MCCKLYLLSKTGAVSRLLITTCLMFYHIWQVQTQSYNRYAETDNRDWCSRIEQPVQTPAIGGEEKSWDKFREAKESYISSGKQDQFNNQDKLSSQFSAKAQVS